MNPSDGYRRIACVVSVCVRDRVMIHMGNNLSEKYPRLIGQGRNDASCIPGSMLLSLVDLPNPTWAFLGNVVSHMGDDAIRICVCVCVCVRSGDDDAMML